MGLDNVRVENISKSTNDITNGLKDVCDVVNRIKLFFINQHKEHLEDDKVKDDGRIR